MPIIRKIAMSIIVLGSTGDVPVCGLAIILAFGATAAWVRLVSSRFWSRYKKRLLFTSCWRTMSVYWRSTVGMLLMRELVIVYSRSRSCRAICEARFSLPMEVVMFWNMFATCWLSCLSAGFSVEVAASIRSRLSRSSLYSPMSAASPGSLMPRLGMSLLRFAGLSMKSSMYCTRLSCVSISMRRVS